MDVEFRFHELGEAFPGRRISAGTSSILRSKSNHIQKYCPSRSIPHGELISLLISPFLSSITISIDIWFKIYENRIFSIFQQ